MTDKFTEYNPHNGTYETLDFTEYESDGKIHVYQQEDVTAIVEQCKAARNQGLTDHGIQRNFWHWARIPNTVYYELLKKGLDPFDKNTSTRRLEQEIDRNWSVFKTTNKRVN